jgi:hypothetical protein
MGIPDDLLQHRPPVLAEALEQRHLRLDDGHVGDNEINGAATELLDGLRGIRLLRRHHAAPERRGDAIQVRIKSDTQRMSKLPHPFNYKISKARHASCVLLVCVAAGCRTGHEISCPPTLGRGTLFVVLPRSRGGAKRSRASEVSFIEQRGGAGPRAVSPTREPTRSPPSRL